MNSCLLSNETMDTLWPSSRSIALTIITSEILIIWTVYFFTIAIKGLGKYNHEIMAIVRRYGE